MATAYLPTQKAVVTLSGTCAAHSGGFGNLTINRRHPLLRMLVKLRDLDWPVSAKWIYVIYKMLERFSDD